MPARKAIEMGRGTILVSLPKDWVRKNGIKKGADISVEELSPGKLMIQAYGNSGEERKQIVIDSDAEDFGQVANDVTSAYLLGYDLIRVQRPGEISREDRRLLKGTLGRLVGLEVLDEDPRRITLQFLLEPTAITPEKIVRRMSGLLDGMLKDVGDALAKGDTKILELVSERDDEVDRLYFLLVRATRAAIVRPEVAERYGLSPIDLLDYRVLATFLESTGDAVTDLSKKLKSNLGPKRFIREYSRCVRRLQEMNDLATKGFLSRRAGKPQTVSRQMAALSQEVSAELGAVAKVPSGDAAVAETLASLDRIGRLLLDVSDLAVVTQQVS